MKKLILIGVGLAGFASMLLSQVLVPCVTTDKVPDLLGLDFTQAQAKWHSAGFHGPMFPNRCCGDDLVVVQQSIPEGTEARCYTPIALIMRER